MEKPVKLNLIKHRVVEMQAFGKARPRVTRNGTFMPVKYKANRDELILRFGGKIESVKPLSIHVTTTRRMPKTWSRKKRKRMDLSPCLTKPDIDNIVGSVMDALLENDSHVFRIEGQKSWGYEDTISIAVYEVGLDP